MTNCKKEVNQDIRDLRFNLIRGTMAFDYYFNVVEETCRKLTICGKDATVIYRILGESHAVTYHIGSITFSEVFVCYGQEHLKSAFFTARPFINRDELKGYNVCGDFNIEWSAHIQEDAPDFGHRKVLQHDFINPDGSAMSTILAYTKNGIQSVHCYDQSVAVTKTTIKLT